MTMYSQFQFAVLTIRCRYVAVMSQSSAKKKFNINLNLYINAYYSNVA